MATRSPQRTLRPALTHAPNVSCVKSANIERGAANIVTKIEPATAHRRMTLRGEGPNDRHALSDADSAIPGRVLRRGADIRRRAVADGDVARFARIGPVVGGQHARRGTERASPLGRLARGASARMPASRQPGVDVAPAPSVGRNGAEPARIPLPAPCGRTCRAERLRRTPSLLIRSLSEQVFDAPTRRVPLKRRFRA